MKIQKLVVLIALGFVFLSCLFPPWQAKYSSGRIRSSDKGYSIIFYPPEESASINTTRLLLEWVGIGALCGGVWVVITRKSI